MDGLDPAIIDEVTRRTPGYSGWQQEQWLTHCDDAAMFLGPVGYDELLGDPAALELLRQDMGGNVQDLSRDGPPTAYLFQCRHCGVELADWDVD